MDFAFIDDLEFTEYQVQLRFNAPYQFNVFHGKDINEFLVEALHPDAKGRRELDENIVPRVIESNRIWYQKGDLYNFGFTVLGHCPELPAQIEAGLRANGQSPLTGKKHKSFEVIECKPFTWVQDPPSLSDEVVVQFVTPMRIRVAKAKHKFLDSEFFDAGWFLERLHARIFDQVYKPSHLDAETRLEFRKPDIPRIEVIDKAFTWFDVSFDSTLGGVIGFIRIKAPLPPAWQRMLTIGQTVGVGLNTAKGFGRYLINPSTDLIPYTPAKSLLDLAIEPANLYKAFDRCKNRDIPAGLDYEAVSDFEMNLFEKLSLLQQSIKHGTYRPSPFICQQIDSDCESKTDLIATVRDIIVQQAVLQVMEPLFKRFLQESCHAYREKQRRPRTSLADVDWVAMERKLRTLYGFDPVVDALMVWVTQDVVIQGKKIKRTKGLPRGVLVSRLLTKIDTWIN